MSHQLVCKKGTCYGKLEDIDINTNVHTFYVMPTEFNNDNTNPIHVLNAGGRFDCGENITTIHNDHKPWVIPANINIKPSCLQRQIILRKSRPSEDVNDIDRKSMAYITIDEGHTPCNILSITDSNVTIDNFEIDNSYCIEYYNISYIPKYMKASINIYPTKRILKDIHMTNLKGSGGTLIHIMGISNTFPYTESENIQFQNITDGNIMLDMICGDINVVNTDVIHSTLTTKCNVNLKNGNAVDLLGPRFILYLNEKIFGFSSHIENICKNKSNAINIAVIFISVTLGFLFGLFGYICVQHISESDIHTKIEKDN